MSTPFENQPAQGADEDVEDQDTADVVGDDVEDSGDEDTADSDLSDGGSDDTEAEITVADQTEAATGLYSMDRAFSDFPLSPEVLQGLEEIGYKRPTRVQAMTMEPGLAGRDLLVRSKTGTGKTAAFCIPMIERIAAGDRITRAIVLTPTRELALQVATECAAIAKYKDLRVAAIYGGVGFGPQEDALRAGAEIVVGTPGRILDHMRRGNLDLSQASFATLDEADEMLSMGFYEDVRKILDRTPTGRQVFLFSATVDERVRGLVKAYMDDPEDLLLSTDADKVEGITHVLYETTPDFHKARALLALIDIEQPKSAIIFCNTREDTSTVQAYLARQGLDVELISGELPQKQREKVMRAIKRGELQYLVATDVAARGIDISDLSHVINYSLPEDPAVYLHRTGRTGRIGKKGVAISLAGGLDMHTRATLAKQYNIDFEVRPLPNASEADHSRVERQVKTMQRALGSMAFESYLGTVRALKTRPDGDMLLAAALRGFFLWDRMRKAALEDEVDVENGDANADGSPRESRDSRDARRDGPRRESRSDRPERRDGRREGPRDGRRSDGPRGEGRGEGRRSEGRSGEGRSGEGRGGEGRRVEGRSGEGRSGAGRGEFQGEGRAEAPAQAAPVAEIQQVEGAPESAESAEKKRRRRRRRRAPGEGGAADGGGGSDGGGGPEGGGGSDGGSGDGGAE